MPAATNISGMNIPERRPVLIDGMNLVYRTHYAYRGLTTKQGAPTGLLYGFLKDVLRLSQAGRIIVCWDYPGERWRSKVYPPYKANRKPDPEREVINKMVGVLKKQLGNLGHRQMEVPGLEADDIVSIAAQRLKRVWVYSGDKDLYQVLTEGVDILRNNNTGALRMISARTVLTEEKLTVKQWPAYLALGGDTSDNIRPIPGCGPAGAKKLLGVGVNPGKPLKEQPELFWTLYAEKWGQYWGEVQKAYKVTRLPTTRLDHRLSEEARDPKHWLLKPPVKAPREVRMQKFMGFCSQYELVEFIGKRREFCP